MDKLEILRKALRKSEQNGLKGLSEFVSPHNGRTYPDQTPHALAKYEILTDEGYLISDDSRDADVIHINEILFNHDFAKAIWGSRWDEDGGCRVHHRIHADDSMGDDYSDPDTYHLQEMVIAEDPILYLGENI